MCYCHVLCVILCVMGKVKRLELCWQLYVTALPERDVRNIRPLVFVDSVPVDMRSVREVMLCTAPFLFDLCYSMFRMHLVFRCTAAKNAERQTRSGDVLREREEIVSLE